MPKKFQHVFAATILAIYIVPFSSSAFFGFFEKKKTPERIVEEKLSEDDKIDFVDRSDVDLSKLKSINVFVKDAIDVNCVFKLKSVLQDNEMIYKVDNVDFKNYVVYFKEGQKPNTSLVKSVIAAAGYQSEIKP